MDVNVLPRNGDYTAYYTLRAANVHLLLFSDWLTGRNDCPTGIRERRVSKKR